MIIEGLKKYDTFINRVFNKNTEGLNLPFLLFEEVKEREIREPRETVGGRLGVVTERESVPFK